LSLTGPSGDALAGGVECRRGGTRADSSGCEVGGVGHLCFAARSLGTQHNVLAVSLVQGRQQSANSFGRGYAELVVRVTRGRLQERAWIPTQ